MTLVLAFRENNKNYLIADQYTTFLDVKTNKYIITNIEKKIVEGKNFALAITTPNTGVADFFEHAIAEITIEDSKKGIYEVISSLQKKIHADFVYDTKNTRFSGLLIMKESIRYFDSNLAITRKSFYAIGVLKDMANYILETEQGNIIGKLDHIYEYASTHASRISKTYDIISM